LHCDHPVVTRFATRNSYSGKGKGRKKKKEKGKRVREEKKGGGRGGGGGVPSGFLNSIVKSGSAIPTFVAETALCRSHPGEERNEEKKKKKGSAVRKKGKKREKKKERGKERRWCPWSPRTAETEFFAGI